MDIRELIINITKSRNGVRLIDDKKIDSILLVVEKYIEGKKRKDTDPLHSYMPHVYNQALDDLLQGLKG